MLPLLTALIPLAASLFDRLIPDPEQRAKEQASFIAQVTAVAAQADSNQNAINLEEARHRSIFVAGWRPFLGWVCGAGCSWAYVFEPLTRFTLAAFGVTIELPTFDTNSMMGLLTGMLGLAGMRTMERIQGVIPGTKK